MGNVQYISVKTDDETNITVFDGEGNVYVAPDDHPNYQKIVAYALAGDERVFDLFDVGETINREFKKITDRVSVANGHVFFDGDEIDNVLTKHILRCLEGEISDLAPLVNFFEKVMNNPNEHSRNELYRWLDKFEFPITMDGLIVGYKGVKVGADGGYESISQGKAVVNGKEESGAIPYPAGAEVEMPRSAVQHNPAEGCSTGLHVGTWKYASGFSRGAVMEVHVDPRDVVSVPSDCNDEKMRCCRYKIVKTTELERTEPIVGYLGAGYEDDPCEHSCDCYYEYGECCDCGEENPDHDWLDEIFEEPRIADTFNRISPFLTS